MPDSGLTLRQDHIFTDTAVSFRQDRRDGVVRAVRQWRKTSSPEQHLWTLSLSVLRTLRRPQVSVLREVQTPGRRRRRRSRRKVFSRCVVRSCSADLLHDFLTCRRCAYSYAVVQVLSSISSRAVHTHLFSETTRVYKYTSVFCQRFFSTL